MARGLALSRALLGDSGLLTPADREPDAAGGSPIRTWVGSLIGEIDAEVDRLAAHRETLDHDAIAEDHAGAADRALFDPGRDATLARRYEAASTRELYRALDEFRAAEAAGPRVAAPEPGAPPAAEPIEDPATIDVKLNPVNNLIIPLGSSGTQPGPGLLRPGSGVVGDGERAVGDLREAASVVPREVAASGMALAAG